MQLIRGVHNLCCYPELQRGCVLTIGNFDGVHLGHQKILHRLLDKAHLLNLPSVVMIFEPQPREFFAKKQQNLTAPARLMRLRDKISALKPLGIDYLLCVKFDKHFAQQEPLTFIQDLLIDKLQVKYLSVGDDFRFGQKRTGDFTMLQSAGKKYSFEVEDHHSYCLGKERISSSLVRNALEQDDLSFAQELLGKPYTIRGRVAHGNKLGRTIGFPTANIMLNRLVTPIQGVYAVEIETPNGCFNGIANVGNRPTINGTKPLLEVHLFDFSEQIYGQAIEVRFLKKIRSEIKFANFEALKQQIEQDVVAVKEFFTSGKID
ncbi:bifunctional riboflavin kinase/FAD synthetase [Ursidibacter sp. B-7004-1]